MDNQRNSNQPGVLFLISVQYYLKNLMKNALFMIMQIAKVMNKKWKKIRFFFELKDFQSKLGPYQLNHIFLIMNLLSDNLHIEFAVLQP